MGKESALFHKAGETLLHLFPVAAVLGGLALGLKTMLSGGKKSSEKKSP